MKNVFDIRDYGAAGDGRTNDTQAAKKAAEACRDAGGGTVLVSGGDFVIAALQIYSNTELYIDCGATLRASKNIADYEKLCVIYAQDAHDLSINGRGRIYGEGVSFLLPPEAERPGKHPGIVDTAAALDLHFKCKRMRNGSRPSPTIGLTDCRGVKVSGIRIENATGWTLSLNRCDDIIIDGVTIQNDYSAVSVDGIDLTGCRNAVVSNCIIDTSDDAIVIKNPKQGDAGREAYNIIVRGCTLMSSTNGFKIGTETYRDIRDVILSDCVIYCRGRYPNTLSGIALESVDGAHVENISVNNIVMRGVMAPFFLRLGKRCREHDEKKAGSLRGITLSNIRAEDCDCPPSITGIPDACVEEVRLYNIDINYLNCGERLEVKNPPPEMEEHYPESVMFGDLPAYGLYARHVRGLETGNIRVKPRNADKREQFVFEDVE